MRLILAIAIALPLCLVAQDKKKGPPPEPKNLKVMTGQSGAEVIQAMRAFRTALGVECTYCHVQGDFASDDNPKKEVGRMMILMTRDINGKFTDGKRHVGCYTCHRGATEPPMAAPDTQAK
jgi:hypothetical protein